MPEENNFNLNLISEILSRAIACDSERSKNISEIQNLRFLKVEELLILKKQFEILLDENNKLKLKSEVQ